MEQNSCFFAESKKELANDSLSILNIVKETNPNQIYDRFKIKSCYGFHVVLSGKGKYETPLKSFDLKKGDFFVSYPSSSHKIISTENLIYIYVSFIGNKFILLSDNLAINKQNMIFHDDSLDILHMFEESFKLLNPDNIYSIGCAMFYYTIAKLSIPSKKNDGKSSNIATQIKKYIDDNYQNYDLSLKTVASSLSYNPNYLSMLFKKEFNIQFSVYLQNIRLSSALSLMNSGFTSIKQIASMVGFKDELYFSKLFKKAYVKSPSYFIKHKTKLYNTK